MLLKGLDTEAANDTLGGIFTAARQRQTVKLRVYAYLKPMLVRHLLQWFKRSQIRLIGIGRRRGFSIEPGERVQQCPITN